MKVAATVLERYMFTLTGEFFIKSQSWLIKVMLHVIIHYLAVIVRCECLHACHIKL